MPHEPADTTCGCGKAIQRIGEDVSDKFDYQPGVFTVERHVRGKWVCKCCERIVQAPGPAHVIDKGIPTVGLLAHLLGGLRPRRPPDRPLDAGPAGRRMRYTAAGSNLHLYSKRIHPPTQAPNARHAKDVEADRTGPRVKEKRRRPMRQAVRSAIDRTSHNF
ncbi:IS66 family transposase zinc-finger binding domain-containing protein [Roseateles puraquae]|uniref:IS66 family transposase zinc-finger binding domain-containing protein n=1 Tax=Roseateles puraquae TaxID=431059 RepID=UPI001302FF13|nr:IS66 family transposase zinc-finger binding domain-containing protein [Roseateles puraquae]